MNCVHLEKQISGDAAVRRELDGFELAQIWITDPLLGDLETEQRTRMKKLVGHNAIPVHVIFDPVKGVEIARFSYPGSMKDYLEFLKKARPR